MARPLSEEKRQAILTAATALFAQEGMSASTAKIAKRAKVSEGTIFTYFDNKEALVNQLYLELKQQLSEFLINESLRHASETQTAKAKIFAAWQAYVHWGLKNPDEHQVLAKMGVSSMVSEQTKRKASDAFCEVTALLEQVKAMGVLQQQSVDYVGALLGAMANTTMSFIERGYAKQREESEQSREAADATEVTEALINDGFAAFWQAVTA